MLLRITFATPALEDQFVLEVIQPPIAYPFVTVNAFRPKNGALAKFCNARQNTIMLRKRIQLRHFEEVPIIAFKPILMRTGRYLYTY